MSERTSGHLSGKREGGVAKLAGRFVRYAGVGVIGTAAQYLTLISVVSAHAAGPVTGSVAGAVIGAGVNYELNRRFTFDANEPVLRTLPKFALAACFGMLMNGLVMKWLAVDLQIHYLVSQIVASGVVLVLTFVINSIWTFRAKSRPRSA
jgi:putative flippase GtrA